MTASAAAAADIITRDIVVPPECGGWRLDHFLKRRIGRMSRTRIQAIIGEQISFTDGRPARPSSPVRAGETILLRRPAPIEPEVPRDFGILFEDESVLVIDKPSGLPMHTTAKFWRNTLVALLRERYPDEQMEIAHRIDRETSGVLLIARSRPVARLLTRAFARRTVEKTYLALVKGQPPDAGRIDRPLRLLDTKSRVMMGPAREGEPGALVASTQFRVIRRLPAHALCEARPLTGRQHQIRVHLASLGHPIVGDKLYGASEALFMRACEEPLGPELLACFDGLPRHALHAHRLTFPHPVSKQPVTVESPLPPDLTAHIDGLAAAVAS